MESEFKTKNIKFCAFLKVYGYNPIEVIQIDRGRAEYVYKMEDSKWKKLQIEFNQSKFLEFANAMDSIKDLAY
jgi:hypothetical protein